MICGNSGAFYIKDIVDDIYLDSINIFNVTSGRTPSFYISTEGTKKITIIRNSFKNLKSEASFSPLFLKLYN